MDTMSDEDILLIEDDELESEMLYLLFSVGKSRFAVDAMKVQEMVVLPKTVPLPEQPDWLRGVMNLRKKTYKVIDFRKRVGMKSSSEEVEELIAELNQREAEHKEWIDQLETAIRGNEPFRGATDPHQCKFGKWYDTYTTSNIALNLELKKFDQPHKVIHATAEAALKMKSDGDQEGAEKLIQNRRDTELARMINLFESVKKTLRETTREIVIIIDSGENPNAICVDSVDSVETLKEEKSASLVFGGGSKDSFSSHSVFGRRKGGDDLVMIIDPVWIFRETEAIDPGLLEKAAGASGEQR